MKKRRIRRNVWGNWRGYLGQHFVVEFGTDEVRAGHWLLTGKSAPLAGYESDETIKAAREASHIATL